MYKEIKRRYKKTRNYTNCLVEAATEPKAACIGLSVTFQPLIQRHLKIYKQFDRILFPSTPATHVYAHSVVQKGSKYGEDINLITGWTRDTGIIRKWLQMSNDHYKALGRGEIKSTEGVLVANKLKTVAKETRITDIKPFQLRHLHMPFWTLVVGSLISLLVWVMEFIFPGIRKRYVNVY